MVDLFYHGLWTIDQKTNHMQIDKTTLADLSIFHSEEELSVVHFLDHTQTGGGRDYLYDMIGKPLASVDAILSNQQIIKELMQVTDRWPVSITNGTIMVIARFYESQINKYPTQPNVFNSFTYKLFNAPDFSLTRYTITHCIDFIKGMTQVSTLLKESTQSTQLRIWAERIDMLLNKGLIPEIGTQSKEEMPNWRILSYADFIRFHYKNQIFELIDLYSRIDAFLSLSIACKKYDFCFPEISLSTQPFIEATGLYHPLLQTPTSYNVDMSRDKNFLFLTGANMAGKSTFIKAVGVSVYLAHLGMGVPATKMQLSLFDGLLSNINVVDNIVKGESYFFNEVQRIRNTIEKISDGRNWLILIDELFKGTNVQDAMKCSTTVIEGLRKMKNVLFILSTHLYEIGEPLQQYSNIQFRYFETSVQDEQLVFSYQLKEGISNDRLGYLILRREGVVELLEKL
jgi:DNA mismatch repair protein MutS